jgi:hypothetical protein
MHERQRAAATNQCMNSFVTVTTINGVFLVVDSPGPRLVTTNSRVEHAAASQEACMKMNFVIACIVNINPTRCLLLYHRSCLDHADVPCVSCPLRVVGGQMHCNERITDKRRLSCQDIPASSVHLSSCRCMIRTCGLILCWASLQSFRTGGCHQFPKRDNLSQNTTATVSTQAVQQHIWGNCPYAAHTSPSAGVFEACPSTHIRMRKCHHLGALSAPQQTHDGDRTLQHTASQCPAAWARHDHTPSHGSWHAAASCFGRGDSHTILRVRMGPVVIDGNSGAYIQLTCRCTHTVPT